MLEYFILTSLWSKDHGGACLLALFLLHHVILCLEFSDFQNNFGTVGQQRIIPLEYLVAVAVGAVEVANNQGKTGMSRYHLQTSMLIWRSIIQKQCRSTEGLSKLWDYKCITANAVFRFTFPNPSVFLLSWHCREGTAILFWDSGSSVATFFYFNLLLPSNWTAADILWPRLHFVRFIYHFA